MEPSRAKANAQLHMEVKRWLSNHGRSVVRKRRRRETTIGRYERRSERIITLHTPGPASKLYFKVRLPTSIACNPKSEIMATAFLLIERVGDSKALLNEFPCYY
jgi:hypothetical protein